MSAVRLLPWPVHEAADYLLGLFFVLAPFIFGLVETIAFPVFVAAGVVLLVNALLTPGPLAVAEILPVRVHAILDYILAFFLILAPFVFSFGEIPEALSISVFAGVGVIVMSLVTRFPVTARTAATSTPEDTSGASSSHSAP
jgi:hypothetical protein